MLRDGEPSTRCDQCGATTTREEALNRQRQLARAYPNLTPLQPGMRGRFGDREYELLGRLVLTTVEEGTTYRWDEFQLQSREGDVRYLVYDEGRWKLFEPLTRLGGLDAEQVKALSSLGKGATLAIDGTRALVTDAGRAEIRAVEGELTWPAMVGTSRPFLDARRLSRLYSVEWGSGEVECYRGRAASHREVFAAFGLQKKVAAIDAVEGKRRSQLLFAGVCLWLSILAFIAWGASQASGRVVSKGSVALASVTDEGIRSAPLTLDPGMHVYRLSIQGVMREASAWVAGVLTMPDGRELMGVQRDFWDESGYDSDGHWHESDLRASTDFVVKNPGPYHVHLYAERDTPTGSYQTASYELRGGVIYGRYFLAYGIVTMLLAVVFFCVGAQDRLKEMSESSD